MGKSLLKNAAVCENHDTEQQRNSEEKGSTNKYMWK